MFFFDVKGEKFVARAIYLLYYFLSFRKLLLLIVGNLSVFVVKIGVTVEVDDVGEESETLLRKAQ